MFTKAFTAALVLVSALDSTSAHGIHKRDGPKPKYVTRQEGDFPFSAAKFPDVQAVLEGNQRFRDTRDAAAIQSLVDNGQEPPFMMFACSDSRAPEATIFDSAPGTFFMQRNIANQYKPGDENAQSVMAYGITVLGVQHLVVLGHYGCGGVAAAIATAPKTGIDVATHIVQTWIGDIRSLYLSSNRTEIAAMRDANLAIEAEGGVVGEPEFQDPGFRALVEENVKQGVKRLTESSVIANLHEKLAAAGPESFLRKRAEEGAELKPVFVHGWVHDIETGEVIDLNISTGPAGFENFVPSGEEAPVEEETPAEGEAPAEETSSSAGEAASSTESAPESAPTEESTDDVVTEDTTHDSKHDDKHDIRTIGMSKLPLKRSVPMVGYERLRRALGASSGASRKRSIGLSRQY